MTVPSSRIDEKARWVRFAAAALVLTAVITIATLSFRAIDREITTFALARREAIAYLAAATLSEKFERLTDLGISLATRVRFRELVATHRWDEAVAILKDVRNDFPFIDRVALFDRAGNLMADASAPPKNSRGRSFAFRDWYRGVSVNWQPYVSSIYLRPARPVTHVFAVAVPISAPDGKPAGILQMQVRLDQFFGWIKEMKFGAGEVIYVVDSKGRLAYHPRIPPQDSADISQVPAVRQLMQQKAGVEIGYSPLDNEEAVVAYVPVGKHGWGVVAQRSTRTAFAQRNILLGSLLAAYALAALFTAVIAWLVMYLAKQRRRAEADRLVKLELEKRVAERTVQLEAANRDLESFSYSVAHDLRSPLRTIDGFSRIVLEEHASQMPPHAQGMLETVCRATKQMGILIDDLLAFSRLRQQPIHKTSIDMSQLAHLCWKELAPERMGRDLRLEVADLPPALGDPALLKQVWLNLLSNAIKYTRKTAQAAVQVGYESTGDRIAYHVRDNGTGFDMKYVNKLFVVFQRLHTASDYEGTGVGLAIVAHIVQRHDGRIWTYAEPGRGATFYFTLGADGERAEVHPGG